MKPLILALSFFATACATAQTPQQWVTIAANSGTFYEAKVGSFEEADGLAGMLLRVRQPNGQNIFERDWVLVEDCRRGYGSLGTSDIRGNLQYKTDWVNGGGTVATRIANVICALHARQTGKAL